MIDITALFSISYGMYIVCSGDKSNNNGFVSNTVFQITAEPPRFGVSCNKNNFTSDFINKYKNFSISVLHLEASIENIGTFGYKSGRDFKKLSGLNIEFGELDVPILLSDSLAVFECKLINRIDVGTHNIFIGDLINSKIINASIAPMTYDYYREVKKGFSPKNAPTYIDKSLLAKVDKKQVGRIFKCAACGYEYIENMHTISFKKLTNEYLCPVCGSDKSDFYELI